MGIAFEEAEVVGSLGAGGEWDGGDEVLCGVGLGSEEDEGGVAGEDGLDDGEVELGGPEGIAGRAGIAGELLVVVVEENAVRVVEKQGFGFGSEEAGVLKVGG